MKDLASFAWQRMGVISAVVGDINGRFITLLLYFTVIIPFGIGSALFSDPLHRKGRTPGTEVWLKREPVPTDLDSAKLQG